MSPNLTVLTKYGDLAAATRQRFRQYEPYCAGRGIALTYAPLFDNDYLSDVLKGKQKPIRTAVQSYMRRLKQMAEARHADGCLVHCDLLPYVPALFETVLFRPKGPLIYDFDDAIFHQYDNHRNAFVRGALGEKLKPLLRRADLAICGNPYLEQYARQYCQKTMVIPTVVDAEAYCPALHDENRPAVTVGWIGSPSTWKFVEPYVEGFARLAKSENLKFLVVGAGRNVRALEGFEFADWSEEGEVGLIQRMDIGIMPLPDEPWARGKCGYKLIQYMACGLPVVASPVGVNTNIVAHEKTGYLATTEDEWHVALRSLTRSGDLRLQMGTAGRAKFESEYSTAVHGPRFAEALSDLLSRGV